jgi:hypothetical protein
MRSKLLVPGLAVAALGLAACGSSSTSSGSGSSSTTSSSAAKHTGAAPRIYHLKLTGAAETPPGAPSGAGLAVIAFHGSTKVCWRFAHLRGFTNATFAHIHIGPKGKSGNVVVPLSTAPKLHHKGCVNASPTVIKAIEKDPSGYYVNIHSTTYPGGAVRAQL